MFKVVYLERRNVCDESSLPDVANVDGRPEALRDALWMEQQANLSLTISEINWSTFYDF